MPESFKKIKKIKREGEKARESDRWEVETKWVAGNWVRF